MNVSVFIRLALMMFIQFFIWGSWYVTAPNYLGVIGFDAGAFAWTYSVGPIAGMISPFFVGMIADRYFPGQRILGVMHLIGGVCMFLAAKLMLTDEPSVTAIIWLFFAHMLCYYPSLALTNTIAMKNMSNPEREFPWIRVFGTLGWIAAGQFLTFVGWDTSVNMFYLTSGAAVVLGILAFFLPHTPPEPSTEKVQFGDLLGLKAFVLLKDKNYLVFMLASMLICIPLAFYYQIASRVVEHAALPIARTMSYGQVSEIFFMLVMPFFFRKLGVKWMLALGMLAWVVRYALFAFGAPDEIMWMIIGGVVLHGICYDFFFVTGQIYTDKVAPKNIRAQAQGMLVLFTLGLGMLIGAQVAGRIEGMHTTAEGKAISAELVETNGQIKELNAAPAVDEALLTQLQEKAGELRQQELAALEWKPLWMMPALFAAAVLVIFFLLFRGPKREETSADALPH